MIALRSFLLIVVLPLGFQGFWPAAAGTGSIAPGLYCQVDREDGTWLVDGKEVPIGNFLMQVKVTKGRAGPRVDFWNVLPDRPDVLASGERPARIERDGALLFFFTDVMGNKSRGRVWPNGKVRLTVIHESPDNQIGRNYGDFRVTRRACAAPDFKGPGPEWGPTPWREGRR